MSKSARNLPTRTSSAGRFVFAIALAVLVTAPTRAQEIPLLTAYKDGSCGRGPSDLCQMSSVEAMGRHVCKYHGGLFLLNVQVVTTYFRGIHYQASCYNNFDDNVWQGSFSFDWIQYCPPGYRSTSNDTCVPRDLGPNPNLNNLLLGEGLGVCQANGAGGGNPFAGNPIHLGTGNKYEAALDYQGAGTYPLRFERHYNSLIIQPYPRALGAKWSHSYQRRLTLYTGGVLSGLEVQRPDGHQVYLHRAGAAWAGSFRFRVENLNDAAGTLIGYRLHDLETDETETYDARGRLETIRNRAGLTQQLYYAASPEHGLNLIEVRDDAGRSLRFEYDARDRITAFIDPAGARFTYHYDQTQDTLVSVTDPTGASRRYHYEDTRLAQFLTGITDELGTRYATFAYGRGNRAILSEHAGGAGRIRIDDSNALYQSGQINVHRQLDDTRTVVQNYQGHSLRGQYRNLTLTTPCAACGTAASARYDPATSFATSQTDHNGNQTCYRHDSVGRETERIEGLLSNAACPYTAPLIAPQRKITTTWHANFRLITQRAEPLRRTT